MNMATKKEPKPSKVSVIDPASQDAAAVKIYALLRQLVDQCHVELREAEIVLAWRHGWKPNQDGFTRLGQLKKSSELDRKLHNADLVILLNAEAWHLPEFAPEMQAALVDHELCHAARAYDKKGEPKEDSDGHPLFRTRRHEVEEFCSVVERHGVWTASLARLQRGMSTARDITTPLLNQSQSPESTADQMRVVRTFCPRPGEGANALTISAGGRSVTLTSKTREQLTEALKGRRRKH